MSLHRIALSTAAMSSVNVLKLLAQLVTVPVLARLLSPADYGLIGIAMPFVLFIMLFADSGIGMSLVRTPLEQRREWSTGFWLCALLGVGLAGLMALLGLPLAAFYGMPELRGIIAALALIVFLQSLLLVPIAALQQARRFGLIAISDLVSIVVSILTALTIACYGGGVWALVGQQLALYATRLFLIWPFSPFRPQVSFHWDEFAPHLRFGRDVLGVSIVNFMTRSIDNLVIGKVLGAAPVGIYAMAFQFLRLPAMIVAGPLQYVLYGQLTPVRDDREQVRATFLLLTRLLALLVFPAMAMVAAAHQPFFHLLLSPKWAEVGELFSMVAAATALQAVTGITGTLMLVFGRTDIQLRIATEFGLLWLAGLLLSVMHGLGAVALAYTILILLYTPRSLSLSLPVIGISLRVYAGTLILPALFGLVGALAYQFLVAPRGWNDWLDLATAVAIGLVVVAACVGLQWRQICADLQALQQRQPHQQQVGDADSSSGLQP